MKKSRNPLAILAVVVMLSGFIIVPLVLAAVGVDSTALREEVSVENIISHLEWLEINGSRVSGTPGYDIAAAYFANLLQGAGYDVTIQEFAYDLWEELSDPMLEQTSPDPKIYPPYDPAGFATMEYSGAGDVTALVVEADNFGCDPTDFDGLDFTGKIAVIERGVCNFSIKAINAESAGAFGVVVYNDAARQDAFLGTLGGPVVVIPVVGSSYAVGRELVDNIATVHLFVDSVMHYAVPTSNVIAETQNGRDDRVVVVGAHLDSVAAGPGINDNGSGAAAILEIALQMAELNIEPRNKVRFAWWGAEESGLIGSQYYVDNLSKREIKNIALNLNFDMVASPNFVRFVYDGDGSDTPLAGPNGSANIESVFVKYFLGQGLPVEATAFDGRSDYGPFIDAGIPAGGLFTGADEIKTDEQAGIYGGTAGEDLDSCYHTSCDDLTNINEEVLEEMADAAAHAIQTFVMTTSAVNGTDKGKGLGKWKDGKEYRGSRLQK
jgi:Zn-dependent M28 family amino/carboxypeptidase